MFANILRERQVRRTLKAIARQRVALVLQPGNISVIELSPPREEWFELGVRTAQIRGWVDILHENLPTGTVGFSENTPQFPKHMAPETHYRLTEGGWAVLNRSQAWVLATFLVSSLALLVSTVSLAITWISIPKL